jgi:hypothetical protein
MTPIGTTASKLSQEYKHHSPAAAGFPRGPTASGAPRHRQLWPCSTSFTSCLIFVNIDDIKTFGSDLKITSKEQALIPTIFVL